MKKYIGGDKRYTKERFGKVRKWLGSLTPIFAVCLAFSLLLSFSIPSGVTSYAADVSVNPLINSNVGKHSEWFYGFNSIPTDSAPATKNDITGGYANWFAQLGVDTGEVKIEEQAITQSERAHQLVQASSYKVGATDKVFIINTPEEAAKVWTEAVEFALGQSKDSPFKVNEDGNELGNGLKQTYQDQSKDPITGEVQNIPGGGVAHGNYFADPYYIGGGEVNNEPVNGTNDQIGYKGQYITVKLNCDWYAKDIETNIAFALGNDSTAPNKQEINYDKRWITTFNWAKDEETFKSYWLGEDNWAESGTSRADIRGDYSDSKAVTQVPGENGNAENRQLTNFTTDGHGYDNNKGYYASYDLATIADQVKNAGDNPGFNLSSPFSYGRINVPTGVYIVLDLNGHTISRGLTEENNEEISLHGSILKSKYEYNLGAMDELNKLVEIYDGTKLGDRDGGNLYGNELCYYGSVITIQPKARLEIMDSSAFERASDGRITASGKTYTTNHKGTVTGGCDDEKYYTYMDNDLGVDNGAYFGYNSNEGKGGAVHVNASGELIVHSGTFKDNQAQYGGAFYALSRAAVLVYNGYFINNYATIRGGGTYIASASRSVFTFYDGVISYNRAGDAGGGVFLCDNAYVNLHGGYITHNQAGNQGGGVYIGSNGAGLLENVNITHNVAGKTGGGIYVHKDSKFRFAGSLIVTQNYGDCGEYITSNAGGTGDKGSSLDTRVPYILRLTVGEQKVRACGWNSDGIGGYQSTYDWEKTEGNLTLISGYKKISVQPAVNCTHSYGDKTEVHKTAGGQLNGKNIPPDYPMWSLGDAFNKEYNRLGGVIWKNKEARGDVTKIAQNGTDNNVYLESGAKIIIDGQLFKNGIGAQIGVTMAGSGDFTSNYKDKEGSVIPQLYFTSDDTNKSVTWNSGNSEATLGAKAGTPTELTWEITGYLYGKTDDTITITATGNEETSFSWSKNGNGYKPDGVTEPDKTIDSFKWTGKNMMFDHKMFEVTQVVAKNGGAVKSTWNIDNLSGHTSGVDYTFHFLLAKQGEDEKEIADKRLVYAGDYSFRVNEAGFSNATFTIHINQLGVAVSAYEVKNGTETWRAGSNPFKDGNTPSEEEIKEYLKGALYYRGTPYEFVLDKKYNEGKKDKYKDFTGAVMKFVYSNTDFFGSNVEIDFGAVDFSLEYYWRELTDNTQQELEKTNYFLHAGYYEVRGAHEVEVKSSVDYMKNNITFESEMHLPIQRVSVSVWLEEKASIQNDGYYGYTFKNAVYTTKQILYFNNNDEAGNDPELDNNVVVQYYDFDDYILHGTNATPIGIEDTTGGGGRWGVKDAGKYVVHVSLNTQMWIEGGDLGKDDFTERGKPYNDYIFSSKEDQRMTEETTKDEQGRDVEYEFAYFFFIQPAVVTSWEEKSDPDNAGAGYLNIENRTYDATATEPVITGKMRSATEQNAFYNFVDFTGKVDGEDNKDVIVRYLPKDEYSEDEIRVTADDIQADAEKWTDIWEKNGKEAPTDAGDYWILVYYPGVMPTEDNKGNGKESASYNPVTNFKGVYIGTYTIKPVEVTVSGSLSYTYDGRSYERARYLPPRSGKGEEDAWYESIFFLVQDGITTPTELVENQHADEYTTSGTYQSWDGDTAQNRSLRDLWGGNNDYKDAAYYKSRFTLENVTVSYSNEEFKQHDIDFGIGLYAFKTKTADQGVYRLTTVDADENGKVNMTGSRVDTEPTNEGVTWIITYKPKDGVQTQAFNTSPNFVIKKAESWLNVTINRKNVSELAPDITKVGNTNFTHWKNDTNKDNPDNALKVGDDENVKTSISYPFAGDNWKYEPGVIVEYQPFYYAESVTSAKGKTEYGDALTLNEEDFGISWMNNSNASTDSNSAHIMLVGKGNYTGTLMLDFTIAPAQIAVEYAGVGFVPQYDKTAHSVNVKYANVEDDATYRALVDGKVLFAMSGVAAFDPTKNKPTPDASVYTITYKARTRTADGFGEAAAPNAITDTVVPIDAGVYDVKIVLGSNNYQFVSGKGDGSYFAPVEAERYSSAATGSHTILPAVVSYEYTNSGEIYDRQTHTPQIKFTNITYQKHSELRLLQNVVPLSLGDDYEVEIAPVSTESYGTTATDAGEYYVRVKLKSHNYCFDLELVKNKDLIVGYKDGAAAEGNYPESRNDDTYSYSYNVHAESKDYEVNGETAAVKNFVIEKATITLDRFDDSTYNREKQEPSIVFDNTERNNQAVPVHNGENSGVSVLADEFSVAYKDENVISSTDSLIDGVPFYSDLYSVTISLTEAGKKNFKFKTQTIPQPRFTHKETANSTLLGQRLGDGGDDSVLVAPFLINRVDITITQRFVTDVYNAKDHFAETAGITLDAVENWVSAMFGYSSSAAIEADDLTVEIEFSKKGSEPFATAYYYPNNEGNKVSFGGKEDYTFADFAKQEQFTHVADYTITVRFTDKSFYIANAGASNDELTSYANFEYSITPAQISFSLENLSFPYDTQEHKPTYPDGGINLTNTRDDKVLPKLASGESAGVGEVSVAYGYSGWAGSEVENSDGFKNVGTYTVTLTIQDGGDFRFADGSYILSRNFTIDAMDISKSAGNFGDAVFTPNLDGHSAYKIPVYHYTGTEIKPEITLEDIKGYDITLKTTDETPSQIGLSVAYTKNVNAGNAKATLTGINNFSGSRDEDFWVLPAIVSITAKDSSGRTETFNPNEKDIIDKGSLAFSYNGTLQSVSFEFDNLCETDTFPTDGDYTVEYYKVGDWDTEKNVPKDGAIALDNIGVVDKGEYFVWFRFKSGSKEFSNFVFYKENSKAERIDDMFDTKNAHLFSYGFKVTVTAAEIDVYLNAFLKGGEFNGSFVFDATNQSVKLGSIELKNNDNVIPAPEAYSVTFFYDLDGYRDSKDDANVEVYDVGKYTLYFRFIGDMGVNYVLRDVYAGSTSGDAVKMTNSNYHDKTDSKVCVNFELTPAEIDVYFSAGDLKNDDLFINEFYYNRYDWTSRFGMVTLDNTMDDNNAVPTGSQYSIEYYHCRYDGKTEDWGETTPIKEIINIGRYSVTFRLSNELTGHYPNVKHYNNYTIREVFVGGSSESDSVKLGKIDLAKNPTSKDGYRVSQDEGNNVYITLVFDILPCVIHLEEISDKVFNDDAQDAGFAFSIVDSQGSVLPEAVHEDFTLLYSVDEDSKTGNERMKDGKPYFAGAYTVSVHLSDNFVFDIKDGSRDASGKFNITPVVLSAFLGYQNGDEVVKGESTLTYDGKEHNYQVYTNEVSVKFREDDGDGNGNILLERSETYDGWAKTSDGHKNAGTYTVTLSFYIFNEDGTLTGSLGGNFCFGAGTYTISLTYAITPRSITDSDVFLIDGTLATEVKEKTYNGKSQTDEFVVKIALTEGADPTVLTRTTVDIMGDYSISNMSDINVGHVETMVTGMNNYQGVVNLSYEILPAKVTATIDMSTLAYNGAAQPRSFRFVNESGTEVLPSFSANEEVSDYTVTYYYQVSEGSVEAPRNAGEYVVTVTLKNSTGSGAASNFIFDDAFTERKSEYVAVFTFTVTKAEIYLDAIPDALYTGEELSARIGFVNAVNDSVVPSAYDVTYNEKTDLPKHVLTDGSSRTPIAYKVKVTLRNDGTSATDSERDLDNFVFVSHSSPTYVYDEINGAWGQEDFKITPAVISGSLSVKIDGVENPDLASNVYNAKKHALDVIFYNINAGFGLVIPVGTRGEAKKDGLTAKYEYKGEDGKTVLYTLTITFTPNYEGFVEFDGIPENAGSYLVVIELNSADFSFVNDQSASGWTYVITNAKIQANADGSLGEPTDAVTFSRSYDYAPDKPRDIILTKDNFVFVEDKEDFNVSHVTFTFTTCKGPENETIVDDSGRTIGYRLKGAGVYNITATVDAPNHDKWEITLRIFVSAQEIKLTVTAEAHFTAVYGDAEAYTPEKVLEQILQFIREGKILVEGIDGNPERKADTLKEYGFAIGIFTRDDYYSTAHFLKAGNYGLKIADMKVGGSVDNLVTFDNDSLFYSGDVFTVTPLAIEVATKEEINDLRYDGTSLVSAAASNVVISNLFEGDEVFFASARYGFSEGGNFNRFSVFEPTSAIHVGNYWVRLYGREADTKNGLSGADSENYMIENKDTETIRYRGKDGVYVAFEIKRREVDLAITDSTSIYGDGDAVYGANGTKKFTFSYIDNVLTNDFGSGENVTKFNEFVRDLLALFDSEGVYKLVRAETPYPGVGNYVVKLDPDAGKTAEGGRFIFDNDYILRIDDSKNGTHTIEKRNMRVSVNDYSSFYGETLKDNGFEGSEGAWGFNALDDFVKGDSEKDLAITIKRNDDAFKAQGTKDGQWWGAMTYINGLSASSASANYNVTFNEGTGNYIILSRPIVVLIGSRDTVYGEPILRDFSNFDGNWSVYETKNDENMGYADGDGPLDLKLTFTLDGIVNENASAGVYEGVIRGNCGNSNYEVTFHNLVVTDGKNEPGEHEGGDYEITKRPIAIRIGNAEAVYGTEGLHIGAPVALTAPVYPVGSQSPTNEPQWTYDFDKANYTILPQDLVYLTFYLDNDPTHAETRYATVGDHAIVGRWGFGYEAETTFMKSYDVQFFGNWDGDGAEDPNYRKAGIFTVLPANITQRNESDWSESRAYRMWPEGSDKTPENGWYAMQILANYLVYAGDFVDASNGNLVFAPELSDDIKLVYRVKVGDEVRAIITYYKPENTSESNQDAENYNNLWSIHNVGTWEMRVTVEAENHNNAEFILTYNVVSVNAKVMLDKSIVAMEAVYGEYEYFELAPDEAYDSEVYEKILKLPLTAALKEYLENTIVNVDGLADAYPGTNLSDWIRMILENCWVEVVDAKISSSGKLQAGTYHLRIVAHSGCGFTVNFVDGTPNDGKVDFSGYDRLIIDQKELGIDWVSEDALGTYESMPEVSDIVTYIYSSYEYHFAPLFTEVFEGDFVDDPSYKFLNDKDTPCKPRYVGSYRISVDNFLLGEDAKNYKLPEKLEIGLKIVPMPVTVTLYDREITYGEDLPKIVSPTTDVDGTEGASWSYDRLGVYDDISALGIKISYLDGKDAPVEYYSKDSKVGVYRIVGTSTSTEYVVRFTNERADDGEAALTIGRAHLTVKIESSLNGNIYGNEHDNLQFAIDQQEGDDKLAYWDDKASLGIELSIGNAKNVGSYHILGSWTNKNYNIVFTGDWEGELPKNYLCEDDDGASIVGKPQGAGTYVISPRPLTLKLPDEMQSVYGDYSIDGTPGTKSFLDYVREKVEPEAGQSFAYKENVYNLSLSWTLPNRNDVGVYVISAEEDNDSNYDVDFVNTLTWTVTKRPVTVTVYTQHSFYGDPFVELDGNDPTFWTAENLAPWHTNAVAALGIQLSYDKEILGDRAKAGTYEKAIRAVMTQNTDNYDYLNEDDTAFYGTYVVDQRRITLEIGDFESTFGDYYEEDKFNGLIVNGYKLSEGSSLASWDAEDPNFVLGTILTKAEGFHAGVYPISGKDTDDNYEIVFAPLKGFFTIKKATNEWVTHFSLESMNEGEMPDEKLLSASAKFGKVTVKYYYDELCLMEVTDDLNTLPKNTYYAKITVEDMPDYTGLEEIKAFIVNDSFLIVNGALDVTLYVCIFASQFIILTCALIFIRRREKKNKETEELI